jgi:hypothetical protein
MKMDRTQTKKVILSIFNIKKGRNKIIIKLNAKLIYKIFLSVKLKFLKKL